MRNLAARIAALWNMQASEASFPPRLIAAVVAVCLLPTLLNLLGIDFGTPPRSFVIPAAKPNILDVFEKDPHDVRLSPHALSRAESEQLQDDMHRELAGSFVHTILEWLAFATAVFTVCLALIHYSIARDVVTPIIGIALFCAGTMDALHTLVADRLLPATVDAAQFIPFTWALSRLFHVLILIAGASLFLVRRPASDGGSARGGMRLVLLVSLFFGLISYVTIHICATTTRLPATYFPDWIVKRPWDAAPLILYLIAGGFVLPRLHRRHPSLFSHALIISIIPNVAAQLHAAFGSEALFDNHFNIADFLKIIAYLVPLLGLMLDYRRTYRTLEHTNAELGREVVERKRAEERLAERAEELARDKVRAMQDTMKRDRAERIDQAQRASQAWLRVARELRQRLTPAEPPPLASLEISGLSHPGEEPGGDYFDYLPLGSDKLGIVVGNVSGRGLSPAMRMAELCAYLRATVLVDGDPAELLTRINAMLAQTNPERRPVTLFFAMVDPANRSLSYAAAGQRAYIIDADGQVKVLEGFASPLGMVRDLCVPAAPAVMLKPGNVVLLASDGLLKAMSPRSNQTNLERMLEILHERRHKSAKEIVSALYGSPGAFAVQSSRAHDVTLVILKVLKSATPREAAAT